MAYKNIAIKEETWTSLKKVQAELITNNYVSLSDAIDYLIMKFKEI